MVVYIWNVLIFNYWFHLLRCSVKLTKCMLNLFMSVDYRTFFKICLSKQSQNLLHLFILPENHRICYICLYYQRITGSVTSVYTTSESQALLHLFILPANHRIFYICLYYQPMTISVTSLCTTSAINTKQKWNFGPFSYRKVLNNKGALA